MALALGGGRAKAEEATKSGCPAGYTCEEYSKFEAEILSFVGDGKRLDW